MHYSLSSLDRFEKAINRQGKVLDIPIDWNREGGNR